MSWLLVVQNLAYTLLLYQDSQGQEVWQQSSMIALLKPVGRSIGIEMASSLAKAPESSCSK